jgi:arylsulfatase A-like enzyme
MKNTIRNIIFSVLAILFSFTGIDAKSKPPNIILIFIDDLGYGDLGCYGSTIHRTPHVDKLAADGIRVTDFYVASPVCTPSRAALLTGCYAQRVDMHVNEKPEPQFRAVLGPISPKGLNPEETTIAEMLKKQGYKTACIGKWHLGDQPQFFPTNHGFDYFYGILTSHNQGTEDCPLAMFEQEKVVQYPVNIPLLTRNMTEKTVDFIQKNSSQPFFVYLPHPMPHFPVDASEPFKGKSADGIYGDAVAEIDWSVGEVVKTLQDLGIEENTIIVFTSDNGGEARKGPNKGGLNWPLRGHKSQVWEGGIRVPCILKWPGKIPEGKDYSGIVTAMDFLPTFATLTGGSVPEDRVIDGKDISRILVDPENAQSPHETFFYYDRDQLQAVRWKNWKLHLEQPHGRFDAGWKNVLTPFDGPQLYDLNRDITESYNVAAEHPEIVQKMNQLADSIRLELGDYRLPGKAIRKAGWVKNPQCMTEVTE